MKNTKFLVKINRTGSPRPQYVQRVNNAGVETTSDRKRALIMAKFTAQDAMKSLQNARCMAELIPIQVSA
ncbi:MAG TPA: hypothetical protein VF011_01340 [Terriglobales bacterium]